MIRILVIEDDPNMRNVLVTLLTSEGFEVESTDRGDEAIRLATDSRFDLVVADIRTEGRSGLDAIEEVSKQDPGVKSLVITGYSSEEESIRAIRLGVKEYFKKPFKMDDFMQSVRGLAAAARAEKERKRQRTQLEESLLWSLSFACDCLNKAGAGESVSFSAVNTLAEELCESYSLGSDSVRAVKIGCLIYLLQAKAGTLPPLGSYLQKVVTHLDERWDGEGGPEGLRELEIPVESRVGNLLLALLDQPDPRLLSQQHPGRFEPELLESYLAFRKAGGSEQASSMAPGQQRSLVRLGRAMEDAGNLATARNAFEHVRRVPTDSRERMAALRGLARIAVREGRTEETVGLIEESLALSARLGPISAADSHFEAALLFHRLGREQAHQHLESAQHLFERNGLSAGLARTRWALAKLGRETDPEQLHSSLKVLNEPHNIGELVSSAGWLLSPFLTHYRMDDEVFATTFGKLLQDAAGSVLLQLKERNLSEGNRLRLTDLLKDVSGPGRDKIAAQLLADDSPKVVEAARSLAPAGAATTGPPVLRIFTMGPLETFKGDVPIQESDWKTKKVRYLFAQLAYKRGRPVAEEILLETLWPDTGEKGRGSLYWASSTLRRVLRPEGFDHLTYIQRNSGHLQLDPELPRWHDTEELEDLLASVIRVPQGERPDNLHVFRKTLELYRGPFLENCYLDWAQAVRVKLEQDTSLALLRLAQWSAEAEYFEAVKEYCQAALDIDECNQAAHLEMMKACLSTGQPEAALRQFQTAESVLWQTLQIEPSTDLIEWKHRALLLQP